MKFWFDHSHNVMLRRVFELCEACLSFRTSVLELERHQVSNESLILAQNQRWRRA
jgi:hypothetical protein